MPNGTNIQPNVSKFCFTLQVEFSIIEKCHNSHQCRFRYDLLRNSVSGPCRIFFKCSIIRVNPIWIVIQCCLWIGSLMNSNRINSTRRTCSSHASVVLFSISYTAFLNLCDSFNCITVPHHVTVFLIKIYHQFLQASSECEQEYFNHHISYTFDWIIHPCHE